MPTTVLVLTVLIKPEFGAIISALIVSAWAYIASRVRLISLMRGSSSDAILSYSPISLLAHWI